MQNGTWQGKDKASSKPILVRVSCLANLGMTH